LNDPSEISLLTSEDQFTFEEKVINNYYPYDETNWVIGNVEFSTTQTSIKDHGSQTKIRQFDFYLIGDQRSQKLWKEIIEPGDPLGLITEYDYYPNGNIKSILRSAPNANPPLLSRLSTLEYAPVYQSRFITKVTDPFGYFTKSTYNSVTGKLESNTDINALTVTYSSNLFATYYQSKSPDGTQNMKVLRLVNGQPEAPLNALFFSWEQMSGSSETYIYYDKLGRVLRIVTKGFDNTSIFVDQKYDQYGRLKKISDPYFSGDSPLYTEEKYNSTFPRVDYKIFPDQTQLWYTYNGLTTITTNEVGQTTMQKKNAIGLLDESTDANSQTVKFEYSYNSNDLILLW